MLLTNFIKYRRLTLTVVAVESEATTMFPPRPEGTGFPHIPRSFMNSIVVGVIKASNVNFCKDLEPFKTTFLLFFFTNSLHRFVYSRLPSLKIELRTQKAEEKINFHADLLT